MENNIIIRTDSYKVGHAPQYPKGTEEIHSYFESRGGDYDNTVFFGLQYLLKKHLVGQVVTKDKIAEAKDVFGSHFGSTALFNEVGWNYILNQHGGMLPLEIKAVPEGTPVPTSNVLMTIRNTDKSNTWWLTNYVETLLVQTWYPTTVATQSREIKKMIASYANSTGDVNLVNFKLHDFGFRGASSVESAGIGGLAHLINFLGTDTMEALMLGRQYYNEPMAGFSIPASEHSTMTSWGKENEVKAYENMLDTYPEGLVACVSDSYDIYNACNNLWGGILKDKIMNRNGTLVVRPDSGDPVQVVTKVLDILGGRFGYTINDKGYKVLDSHIRVIQGDGVDRDTINGILWAMKNNKWSTDNIAFGMGGALLQKLNRDTQKFAFKCSSAIINGEQRNVKKEPITDSGKNSKQGYLKLIETDSGFATVSSADYSPEKFNSFEDRLRTVFLNGELKEEDTFAKIRERALI